jgi:hypothetical protein
MIRDDKNILTRGYMWVKFLHGYGADNLMIPTDKINGCFNYPHLMDTNAGLILFAPADIHTR